MPQDVLIYRTKFVEADSANPSQTDPLISVARVGVYINLGVERVKVVTVQKPKDLTRISEYADKIMTAHNPNYRIHCSTAK